MEQFPAGGESRGAKATSGMSRQSALLGICAPNCSDPEASPGILPPPPTPHPHACQPLGSFSSHLIPNAARDPEHSPCLYEAEYVRLFARVYLCEGRVREAVRVCSPGPALGKETPQLVCSVFFPF